MTKNTWGTEFKRPMCNSCYAKGKLGMNRAVRKKFGPGEPRKLIEQNRPPVGTPCKNCKTPMTSGRGKHACNFDHNPVTETFRGWICKQCNTSIGGLGDSIESLERALKYLYETTH